LTLPRGRRYSIGMGMREDSSTGGIVPNATQEGKSFFSQPGLVRLFERCGFEPVWLTTVSKVNRGRIEGAVGVPGLAHAIWGWLYVALSLFELFGRGMVINAHFRAVKT